MHPPSKRGLLEWVSKRGVTICDTKNCVLLITLFLERFQQNTAIAEKGCKLHRNRNFTKNCGLLFKLRNGVCNPSLFLFLVLVFVFLGSVLWHRAKRPFSCNSLVFPSCVLPKALSSKFLLGLIFLVSSLFKIHLYLLHYFSTFLYFPFLNFASLVQNTFP